jgi:NAD(P)-dependent dehydrogenase (short-subunit alcohol dehydrogenase family)
MQRLKDKIALVTGSGSGIGESICYRFAQEGAAVAGMDINQKEAERVAEKAQQEGGRVHAHYGDVSNKEDCSRVVEWTKANLGKINVLCNVAGIVEIGDLLETSEEAWQRSMDVNLKSMYYLCQLVIPDMIKQGGGSIINISSVAGLYAAKKRAAYSITKSAIIGLTKTLATDFVAHGIRANAICPGTLETPSFLERVQQSPDPEEMMKTWVGYYPIGRLGKTEEVAALAAYMASEESGFMTGQAVVIDGGISFLF